MSIQYNETRNENSEKQIPRPECAPELAFGARDDKALCFSPLEGGWIEIFRAGDYGERGAWTPDDLDRLAAAYNPRVHAAPVVLGHPASDAPAYGWVRALRRAGDSLWAQLEKIDPALEALLRAGRFRQRSVALYTNFAPAGGPYLRHLGFLGAAAPEVKGLAPVRFAEAASVCFAFPTEEPSGRGRWAEQESLEVSMPEPKSKLESLVDHLRAFFTNEPPTDVRRGGSGALPRAGTSPAPTPSASREEFEAPAFAERLAQLEQRLETLAEGKKTAEEKLGEAERARRGEEIAQFVESLRRHGRFPPAFERWGVVEFMERLAASDGALAEEQQIPRPDCLLTAAFGARNDKSADDLPGENTSQPEASRPSLLAWFQEFLMRLPAVIEFRELSGSSALARRSPQGAAGPRASLVHFTEPQRGMTVDPASIELAERAEALAAELGISYAEALAQLREEARSAATTA
ncbi:MAG: hypothetical protein ACRD35_01025 [Candidatus Acidiferrales bacterium]